MSRESPGRIVYIVDGARTPFLKARNKPGPFTAADLAVKAGQPLLNRQAFSAKDIESIVIGSVMSNPDETNIARLIALRLGCQAQAPAYTVQRNCASGMQAIDSAMKDIQSGRHDLVLAGGTEAMSHAPLLFNQDMIAWLSAWYSAKTFSKRASLLLKTRLSFLKPVISILRGLNDPMIGLSMGQTAENLAYNFKINRLSMDEFSVQSHQKLAMAIEQGVMTEEVVPLIDNQGQYYEYDNGLRSDSSIERLAKLKPFFDKKYGFVTPGNSSQITDGAALLILASEKAVAKWNLPTLGRLVAVNWAGVDPGVMGLGPVHASIPLLQQHQLSMNDVDYWEINEAFAAQVLACMDAFNDANYCRQHFTLPQAFGPLDAARLNIHGGAIALGHPVGASGARITLHLAHVLRQQNAKRGVASICIGGGQGGAIIVENGEVAADAK